MSFNSPLLISLQTPVTFSLVDPNIFLSTLISIALRACSSLSEKDQVSHSHKTIGKGSDFLAESDKE
jgi:hypothetical protein